MNVKTVRAVLFNLHHRSQHVNCATEEQFQNPKKVLNVHHVSVVNFKIILVPLNVMTVKKDHINRYLDKNYV